MYHPDPDGGRRSGTAPPENSQDIGFLSNTGPNPLNNHKKKKHASNTGPNPLNNHEEKKHAIIQCWTIIGTPAKRHLNGVSLAGR